MLELSDVLINGFYGGVLGGVSVALVSIISHKIMQIREDKQLETMLDDSLVCAIEEMQKSAYENNIEKHKVTYVVHAELRDVHNWIMNNKVSYDDYSVYDPDDKLCVGLSVSDDKIMRFKLSFICDEVTCVEDIYT
ncbi:hypothetical protein V5T82_14075 [Magnetovibrio sp. PR-2]|uniref:hypothetical protein n=1 Tax=Magnetovibrio sp. PR-2 TaxID=3120356 RepID=UPI002FCE5D85